MILTAERTTRLPSSLMGLAAAMAVATSLAAQPPIAVSPGAASVPVALGVSCPTFSWSGVTGAEAHDLVLYEVAVDGALEIALQTRVPGEARAWSPPASACPEPGLQYAWAVRASAEGGAGEWSEPLLFTTPGAPTADEMRRAFETLRRYRASADGEDLDRPETSDELGEGSSTAHRNGADLALQRVGGMAPTDRTSLVAPVLVAPVPGSASPVDSLTAATLGSESAPREISAPGSYSLSLDEDLMLGGAIFREGYPFLHNDGGAAFSNTGLGLLSMVSLTPGDPDPASGAENTAIGGRALKDLTSGSQNTAVGFDALRETTTGGVNTAVGSRALRNNTTGFSNTAVGDRAARSNTTGVFNTAVGRAALYSGTDASYNTAVGYRALVDNTANNNTAVGSLALTNNTTGRSNTAVGAQALENLTSGIRNTAVGGLAMFDLTTGNGNVSLGVGAGSCWTSGEYNISIGTNPSCSPSDDGVIRIGDSNRQHSTFIAGIFGATASGGSQVFVNSSDELGTITSSARFKQDIQGLESVGERLQALRPVSFRYKDELVGLEGDENPLEYGLIAEEVAEVFPELVIYDDEGEPYTVRYQLLAPLLLRELQRQEGVLRRLQELVEGPSTAEGGSVRTVLH